jgi:hypothetical protein
MLVDALFAYLSVGRQLAPEVVRSALLSDYVASGARASPQSLLGHLPSRRARALASQPDGARHTARQKRHAVVLNS